MFRNLLQIVYNETQQKEKLDLRKLIRVFEYSAGGDRDQDWMVGVLSGLIVKGYVNAKIDIEEKVIIFEKDPFPESE